jgi:hypothetical protein
MKFDSDIGQIREHLQELSRQIFSKKYRLEIAALVAALEPPIWARQVAKTLDIGENQAASELHEFEQLGALQQFPSEFDRRKLYVVVPHWLWRAVREALDSAVRELEPDEGDALVAAYWAAMVDGGEPRPVPTNEGSSEFGGEDGGLGDVSGHLR